MRNGAAGNAELNQQQDLLHLLEVPEEVQRLSPGSSDPTLHPFCWLMSIILGPHTDSHGSLFFSLHIYML